MSLGEAFGGALGGLGQGLVAHGQALRDEARQKREDERRKAERAENRQWQIEDRQSANSEWDRRTQDDRSYNERQRRDVIERGASALVSSGGIERATYVKDSFVKLGYPEHVAAGLVGNIMQESGPGVDTGAVGDGGNAFGMAQWNGPRRKAYLSYAEKKGVDPTDIDTQIEYLDHEFRTTEKSAYDAVMRTTTAEEAALVASKKFWRPGIPHNKRRQAYARQLAEVVSDPNQSQQVRSAAADKLDNLQGTTKGKKLTGEEWVQRGDKEVLMGRNDKGQMHPYTDSDGEQITREVKASNGKKPRELSSALSTRIDDWAVENSVDDKVARKFKLKAEELIQGGMSETKAWDTTLDMAIKSDDVVTKKEGWFGKESVTEGTFSGEFRDPDAKGLGPAPKRTAQATPDMPSEPASPQSAPATPQIGDVVGGYEFMGGDPSDEKNWREAKS